MSEISKPNDDLSMEELKRLNRYIQENCAQRFEELFTGEIKVDCSIASNLTDRKFFIMQIGVHLC
jgi:hypothetical protein